jgi:hypothetical protein
MLHAQSSKWFQEIVAVNGSEVTLKTPGLTFAVLPGTYLASALPSNVQTKSFGMFDSVAAPAVYPIFSVKKASQQTPYSPHDTSIVYDSDHKPVTFDPDSSASVLLSDILYTAALSVSRNTDTSFRRNDSPACPSVVMAAPSPIASTTVSVRQERAPTVRRCFWNKLDDGSTSHNWVSEVQLSNHLVMPFMVSGTLPN